MGWAQGGYVDYLMPQLYWGQNYTKNGSTAQSLCQLAARWAALPRAEDVTLPSGWGATASAMATAVTPPVNGRPATAWPTNWPH